MNFPCPSLPKEPYNPPAGGSSYNGIIHQHHPFSPDTFLNCAQLNPYLIKPCALPRGNKGSADISVFNQSDSVRDTQAPAKSQRCIQPRIRHAHHNIRLRRAGSGKNFPGPEPCLMNGGSVYH